MQASGTQEKIDCLTGCGPLKVWSVVMTVLGDLCRDRHDRVGGKLLTVLGDRMGISPQAMRVALHRLRRDGWIESERIGRESEYFLSDFGWQETQSVRPRIYFDEERRNRTPILIVAPPQVPATDFADSLPGDANVIAPRTALAVQPCDDLPAAYLVTDLRATPVPEWIVDMVAGEDLRSEYAALADCAARVAAAPAPDDLVDATVLRLLVLHHWRRLRLRHGDLPALLLPPNWEGARAGRTVKATLERFPRPTLAALSTARTRDKLRT
jgi:phenylacetic acid degradation operon negative regulatory protein